MTRRVLVQIRTVRAALYADLGWTVGQRYRLVTTGQEFKVLRRLDDGRMAVLDGDTTRAMDSSLLVETHRQGVLEAVIETR